jgi:hypothetical protein
MDHVDALRARLGALALGLSTLLLASSALASAPWLVAQLLAMLAFVLLGCGLLALYAVLATAGREVLALLAAGAAGFARGIWRSARLPRWAGVALALGLGPSCPILPARCAWSMAC